MALGSAEESATRALALALTLSLALTLGAVPAHWVLSRAWVVGARPTAAASTGVALTSVLVLGLRVVVLVASRVPAALLALVTAPASHGAPWTSSTTPCVDLVFALSWLVAVILAVMLLVPSIAVSVVVVGGLALLLVASAAGVAAASAARSTAPALMMTAAATSKGRTISVAVVLAVSLVVLVSRVPVACTSPTAVVVA